MNKPSLEFTTTLEQKLFPVSLEVIFKSVSPFVSLLKLLSLSLNLLCILFLLPLSLSSSSFILALTHIEFLSRHGHKPSATLGLNSKEMSVKSRVNGRSSA